MTFVRLLAERTARVARKYFPLDKLLIYTESQMHFVVDYSTFYRFNALRSLPRFLI